MGIPSSRARVRIACPSGCSDHDSAEAAYPRSSGRERPSAMWTPTTVGVPVVMVPVLSNTTVSTLDNISRWAPSFTKAPDRAVRAMAASTARGVPAAIPQAPATTTTEMVASDRGSAEK